MSAGAWMRSNLATQGYRLSACAMVTALNLCLPSEALAWWERRTVPKEPATT